MAGKKAGKGSNQTAGKGAARAQESGPGPNDTESSQRIKKLVDTAIEGIEKRLSDESSPPSIGDYLKVMQLQKEIEDDAPKEIKVTWVEPEKPAAPVSEK